MIRKVYTNIAHFNVPIEWLLIISIGLEITAEDAFCLENIFFLNKERVAERWQGNTFLIYPIIIMTNALNVRNLVSKLNVKKISRKNNDDSNWCVCECDSTGASQCCFASLLINRWEKKVCLYEASE